MGKLIKFLSLVLSICAICLYFQDNRKTELMGELQEKSAIAVQKLSETEQELHYLATQVTHLVSQNRAEKIQLSGEDKEKVEEGSVLDDYSQMSDGQQYKLSGQIINIYTFGESRILEFSPSTNLNHRIPLLLQGNTDVQFDLERGESYTIMVACRTGRSESGTLVKNILVVKNITKT